jgi:hypothetical protein
MIRNWWYCEPQGTLKLNWLYEDMAVFLKLSLSLLCKVFHLWLCRLWYWHCSCFHLLLSKKRYIINYDGRIRSRLCLIAHVVVYFEIVPYNSCCRILLQASSATAAAVIEELPYARASEYQPDVPGISDRRTGMLILFLWSIQCSAQLFISCGCMGYLVW